MEVSYDDPYVLLVEGKVSRVEDMLPVLEKVVPAGRPLAIIAEDVEGQPSPRSSSTRSVARSRPWRSRPPASAIAARRCSRTWPSSRAGRSSPSEVGLKLENVTLDLLGSASEGGRHQGRHYDRRGRRQTEEIERRVNQLKAEIDKTDSDSTTARSSRNAHGQLSGGVAVIKVAVRLPRWSRRRKST